MAEAVILINAFEVPPGDAENFIAAWEKTRDYLQTQPGYVDTALHQAARPDVEFQFVNIARWQTADDFRAAFAASCMSIVSAANTSWETWRSVSSARLSRIGWSRISLCACSGVSSNRLRSDPRLVARLITISSRVEPMGGLVEALG